VYEQLIKQYKTDEQLVSYYIDYLDGVLVAPLLEEPLPKCRPPPPVSRYPSPVLVAVLRNLLVASEVRRAVSSQFMGTTLPASCSICRQFFALRDQPIAICFS